MTKLKGSKILAVFLAFIMMVGMLPMSVLTTVFATGIDSYSVRLTDGTNVLVLDDVDITLTNKEDSAKTATVKTVAGVANFASFVEEEATYVVSVAGVTGYEDVVDSEVAVAVGEITTDIAMTALTKVTVSGIVTDENGDYYEGATVRVSGYITDESVTNAVGEYSFETYVGKENIIEVLAKAKDEQYNAILGTATYSVDTTDANYQFTAKKFNINTTAGENGTITTDENDVPFGTDRVISIQANEGYRIEKVTVNGVEETDAASQKNFDITLADIKENYDISVSFYRMTYKITFTVSENGEVFYVDGDTQKVVGGSISVDKNFNESTNPTHPTTVTVTATPADDYRVSKVIIDGVEKIFTENDYIYVTSDHDADLVMTEDHTFVVEFSINEYTLSVNCGEHGSAIWGTVGTEATVKHGENATLDISPEEGYAISSVTVNGDATEFIEDENGVYITLENIEENKMVAIEFAKPAEDTPTDKLTNDYYTITFDKDLAKDAYMEGTTYVVVLANDATATITPVSPYIGIKYNTKKANGGYRDSITIRETTTIENIYVKTSVWASNKENVAVNVKIIIDKVAPKVDDIAEQAWTNNDTVTVNGTVTDEGGSALSYIVWSKDSALAAADVLATTENKATIVDGKFSFTSVSGEQNSIYYIYAVDYAGNVSAAKTVQIKIDKTAPTITDFTFSTKENSVFEDLINFATFGTVCKEKMYVTVFAADLNITSGFKNISLYYGTTLLEEKDVSADADHVTFELKEDKFHEKVEIYAVVTDTAGNSSANTKPTDVNVATNAKSNCVQVATDKPTVVITPASEVYKEKISDNPEKYNLWYNDNVEFIVDVVDSVSGIQYVEIKMNGDTLEEDVNGVKLNQDFSKGEVPLTSQTFTVNTSQNPLDGKNTIEVVATSTAGQKSVVYSKDVYIDTTRANIIGYEITTINDEPLDKVLNFLTFGIFYKEQVKIIVTAEDTNASAGVKNITLYLNDEEYATQAVTDNKTTFTVTAVELSANAVFAAGVSAIATDNVNNATETPVIPTAVNHSIKDTTLMLENVAPTATIASITAAASDKNTATKDENDWYANNVEFKVITGDVNSGMREAVITINGTEVAKEVFYNDADADTACYEKVYTVDTGDTGVERAQDGSYTVVATVTDNAGNVFTTAPYVIYKDIDKPYITNFDFKASDFVEGSESIVGENDEALVITTDYGFYFKVDTDVTITAKDVAPTAGIQSITYYTVDFTNDANGVKSAEKTVLVDENNQITITIPANFKGQIYAKATDNVLNVTDTFANPNSAIVESEDKHKEEQHIVFAKSETNFTVNDNTELYANDVDVTIIVTDTYSGIREIEWSVVAPYDTENNQGGKVTLNNDKTVVEGTESDWMQTKTEINLVTEMQKTIKVKNNSNNIIITVKMTDRAGNTSEEKIEFGIDKTDPEISIAYGNDEVHDDEYTDFFSTTRTATITVKERNFRASDIVFAIINTDKVIPTVDLKADATWTTVVDSEDPDRTIHVATVEYTDDGDYTFDIAYKDNAGNLANTVEQHKFAIDMTEPEVTVVYDNNSALNDNYYKTDRIATITIKEHNFDAKRVNIIGAATDNGATSTFPKTSDWKDNGDDTYTATISYTADSKYSFDIEFYDKANNSIADYAAEEFYVDKTAPNLSITGVADNSANNGDVAPVITYSDTNFNKDAVTIVLDGINNGDNLKYTGTYADSANGQTYTFANFEKVQKVDDIYTLTAKLTDMAGNETKDTITFSANRFGSVYDLTGLEGILTKYLQTEEDIVFTETNVDSLEREGIKIKLTKNGTPADLAEGTDYTVKVTGGNGQWSVYKYTIKKELFVDDGRYSLSIYSKDSAGNVNENIDETKAAEISFGIDKTNPVIVPIDLESGVQYAVDMKTVSVEIKDNLVLESVKIYLNDKEVEYTVDGEIYTFNIPKSNSKQLVKIVAVDAAENEESVEILEFLVNANIFVRWFNNTPIFAGSIFGVVVIALGITTFIVFGKKKKGEGK